MWLDHLKTVSKRRKEGAAKAVETKKKNKAKRKGMYMCINLPSRII